MNGDVDRATLDRLIRERGITGETAAGRYFSLALELEHEDGRLHLAEAAYTACLSEENSGYSLALFQRGHVRFNHRDHEGALSDYLTCFDPAVLKGLYGQFEDPYYHAAKVCKVLGRSAESRAMAERSVQWNPTWHRNHLYLAELLRQEGKPEEAKAVLRRAIEESPSDKPREQIEQALARLDAGQALDDPTEEAHGIPWF